MTKRQASAEAREITTFKGFNKDWTCTPNGVKFQYEVGKAYDNGGSPVTRCGDGAFHSVLMPMDAWSYYSPATSNFAQTTAIGDIVDDPNSDTKIASARIKVDVQLHLPEFIKKAAASTGYRAHAASTGNGAHAASTGNGALSAALGARSTAKAEVGGGIVLAHYDESVWPHKLVAVRASLVGENGIEPGKAYRLTAAGEFEEVKV